jgi:RIO kinase 1
MPQARSLRLLIHQKPRAGFVSVAFLLLSHSMDTKPNFEYYNELDDQGLFEVHGEEHGKGYHHPQSLESKRVPLPVQSYLQKQDDSRKTFQFTYKAARFEEGWLLDSLGHFYEQKWISDVLRKLKAGKEASVYLCRSGEQVSAPLVAAKVYRPRMLRNLKNDQLYREGRDVLDEDGNTIDDLGMLRAQHKRSVYGEKLRHQSWIAYEFRALAALHAAGADVPPPYEMAPNAILMGYVGDDGSAAPTLNTITLDPRELRPIYERLLRNIEIMLAHEIVHGDLSAYNVLYWEGDIALIDFPQVVSPRQNRNAYSIFQRDVTRLCEYFIDQGLPLQPRRLAADLWRAHGYPMRAEIHPRLLDADDPVDRQSWAATEDAK